MINVYLISSEIDGKRYYKIGHTRRKVEERIKEFIYIKRVPLYKRIPTVCI
jgi:hypothetical protein